MSRQETEPTNTANDPSKAALSQLGGAALDDGVTGAADSQLGELGASVTVLL